MKTIGSYRIPESWSEVTLEELIQVNAIIRGEKEDVSRKIVNVFNPEVDVEKGKWDDFMAAFMGITEILDKKAEIGAELPKYVANDEEFAIILPEKLDLQEYIDVIALNEADNVANAPLILAILTENRPENARKWAETIKKQVSVQTAMGNLAFFFTNLTKFIEDSPYYSQILQKMKENEAKTTKKRKK